ncbi:DUF3397 domain-containing protein [Alkalicoccus urumqiensis]|nr:DUF3397 domain-containing protein [Alkalicoccus urumqiensis]
MSNIAAAAAGFFISFPVAGLLFFYVLFRLWDGRKQASWKRAADLSVPLFAVTIYFMLLEITGMALGWAQLLFFIIMAGSILTLLYRMDENVSLFTSLKWTWRFHFLLYAVLYGILGVIGIWTV